MAFATLSLLLRPFPFCLPPVTLPRRVSIEPFSFLPCSPDFSILKRFAPPLSLLSHTEYPVCFNWILPPVANPEDRRKENRNLFASAEIRRKDAVEWFPIKIFQQFAARENSGELYKRHNVRELVKIKNSFARLLLLPPPSPFDDAYRYLSNPSVVDTEAADSDYIADRERNSKLLLFPRPFGEQNFDALFSVAKSRLRLAFSSLKIKQSSAKTARWLSSVSRGFFV